MPYNSLSVQRVKMYCPQSSTSKLHLKLFTYLQSWLFRYATDNFYEQRFRPLFSMLLWLKGELWTGPSNKIMKIVNYLWTRNNLPLKWSIFHVLKAQNVKQFSRRTDIFPVSTRSEATHIIFIKCSLLLKQNVVFRRFMFTLCFCRVLYQR